MDCGRKKERGGGGGGGYRAETDGRNSMNAMNGMGKNKGPYGLPVEFELVLGFGACRSDTDIMRDIIGAERETPKH